MTAKELTPQPSRKTLAPGGLKAASRHDEKTLQKLRYAGSIYGAAAGLIFLIAVYFLMQGHPLTGLLTLAPAAILGFMSWHCLRQL